MRYSLIIAFSILVLSIACSCRHYQSADNDSVNSDSIENTPLPDTLLESARDLVYDVTVFDSAHDGRIDNLKSLYDGKSGQFTFRGNNRRDANFGGRVKGNPTKIVEVWKFTTKFDSTRTSMGAWGGGSGWTGEPVYVHWPQDKAQRWRSNPNTGLTPDFGDEEIIVGSLCGYVYFINFETGKASRDFIDVTNPIKGSVSLDPTLNGNLYVGQGIPKEPPMSQLALDLNTREITYTSGLDGNAWVRWSGNDSSPVRVGQYLFWPGENGTIYKYLITGNTITKHSTLRIHPKDEPAAGVENSMCVYKNYGYFGTNHGDVYCIDLNTLRPVWHYDNHDDIDASIVCEVQDSVPYLYCGCEVDRQGDSGLSYLVKLNGLTGVPVWENTFNCNKLNMNGKHFDGGLYSTPLLGKGDCSDLLFLNMCQYGTPSQADFMAVNKQTGQVVYNVRLRSFAWSSPVGFLNENNQQFVFAGDSFGNAYLIEGKTGNVIFTEHMVGNFESSPVVVGNELVVGSRGQEIYKFRIE